jgi:1,4-alpha-glucan branching enzyme
MPAKTKQKTSLEDAAFDAIVWADHGDPFSVLGMHVRDGKVVVRAMLPYARRVWLIDAETGDSVVELSRVRDAGLFVGETPDRHRRFPYRFKVDNGADIFDVEDPYRFPPILGEVDAHLIAEGNHLELFDKLGAHPREMEGVPGVAFAVWAPNARRVSVVGSFNDWDGRRNPMRLRVECGIWELFVPGVQPGALYKFEIKTRDGAIYLKADPFARFAEKPPRPASAVWDNRGDKWFDDAWMAARERRQLRDQPISIYEVHVGSWKRRPEDGHRRFTYRELADDLVPYAKWMGYTHIELLPITEHPFDGSWGYQPLGQFAPTSRYGTPDDFRAFVERCHAEDVGLILDWVPGHFPNDPHGIAYFDGTHLYEHADERLGKHRDWDTLIYNYGRREVANFLLASALFWTDRYHIDGLRVDAVASMLYLDYSRKPGEWLPNMFGGNENLEATAFIRRLNEQVYARGRGAITVAEESTAWPAVSRPTYMGGLGFGYKWNMGWMHDTLLYMSKDPVHRKYHHDRLTFGLLYAFSENFILPLSHDEVVHGKGSLLGRMPGDKWQRFANLRAYFGFMYAQPGKKLLFMGGEFAQEREWTHQHSLDWHLTNDPLHAGVQKLTRDLNLLYRTTPALHERDCEGEGFEWIDCNDAASSTISWLRKGFDHQSIAVAVCNFTPVMRQGYRIGVPHPGTYVERINTDAADYGGTGVGHFGRVEAEPVPFHGRPYSLNLTLPPLATVIFTRGGKG